MNLTLIGVIAVFSAYALNRFLMTGATKKLDDADKLKIFNNFSKRGNYATVIVLGLVAIYFAALQYLPHFIIQITAVYLTVYFAYLIFRFASNYKKLKEIAIPDGYVKSFVISYSLFIVGFLVMAVCLFWNWRP